MRLYQSTFAVTESTFGGSTGGSMAAGGSGTSVAAGTQFMTIEKIICLGETSVAANSSGGVRLHYGESSAVGVSTLVVMPSPTSNLMEVRLEDLHLSCKWYDFMSEEAGQYAVYVFGR